MNKKVKRIIISNDEIIKLYSAGWSINDIVANHKTSVRRVRAVLHERGINTSSYRAASSLLRECVLVLVAVGVPIRKISDTIDISPHLVRQVLRDNKVNASQLRENGSAVSFKSRLSDTEWENFLEVYRSGELGFMKCAEKQGFAVDECIEAVLKLSEDDVVQHKRELLLCIANQQNSGLSASSVSKQLGISTAIVKEIFNKTLVS